MVSTPLAGEHPQAHPAGRQVLHGVDQMSEVAAQPVELPDDETRPVGAEAGGEVVVEVDRVGPPWCSPEQPPGDAGDELTGATAGGPARQITMRSISSTVTVSAVRS